MQCCVKCLPMFHGVHILDEHLMHAADYYDQFEEMRVRYDVREDQLQMTLKVDVNMQLLVPLMNALPEGPRHNE